jgi:succinoglycan biosynthesis protein ExoM
MPAQPLISICVCTFRRPDGLQRLLATLRAISIPAGVGLELVVVDNDAGASAKSVFDRITADWPWPARYVVEAHPGVGFARARCVEEARGDWIAYIDDDEWAEPQWLQALWQTRTALGVDGVFGPVLASYETAPPEWLLRSRMYERPRRVTGTSLHWSQCASGNVLFRKQLFVDAGGFDAAFAQSGSEDSDFFWRCLGLGARFVWCDEAVAHEAVPPNRMTKTYLRRRAFLAGQNYVRLHARRQGWLAYLLFALRGLAIVLLLFPLIWGGRLLRVTDMFRYEGRLQGGLGKMLAAWTPVSREYGAGSSKPPGSQG